MSLSMSQIKERVASKFPDVEQISDSVLRFTKNLNESPYAVYYFDIAQDLPESQEELTKYQDTVIGSHYFEGRKSLQWNNYLYFITQADRMSTGEVRRIKELIERDRSYARKFVIPEEALESVITPPVIVPTETTPHASVLSIWTEKLVKAGLDRAIFCDDDLPTRLSLIESSHTELNVKHRTPKRIKEIEIVPFIRSFQLNKFRKLPTQRLFTFGIVNLIFGANGSGKTSLLEAIELFYCGRNRRNPDVKKQYELAAVFANGQSEIVRENRGPRIFRDRNLMWYGQAEIKTNNLYQSFAQFNFLDTDAAVRLVDSPFRIEEDLSRLLVGPDASKTWRDIERVAKAVTEKLSDLRYHKTQIDQELASLKKLINSAIDRREESDSICLRLEEMLDRVGWHYAQGEKETFAASLIEELLEFELIAQIAKDFDWLESPVSIEGLAKYCHDVRSINDEAEISIVSLGLHRNQEKKLTDTINHSREALALAKWTKRMIQVGLPDRIAERNNEKNVIGTYLGILAGLKEDYMGVLASNYLDMEVIACHDAASSNHTVAEELLVKAKSEYTEFSRLKDKSINFALELRQVATKILNDSRHPDECPLCHTQFDPGELIKHINLDVNEQFEAFGQKLLARLKNQETEVRNAIAVEIASSWLIQFCDKAKIAKNISVRAALTEAEKVKKILSEAYARVKVLDSEVLALESQGFSMVAIEDVSDQLKNLGYPTPPELSMEAADRLVLEITNQLSSSSTALETERNTIRKLLQELAATLGLSNVKDQEVNTAMSQLKERLTTAESLRERLNVYSSLFPWPEKRPLAELVVEAGLIRKVAVELQTAIGKEKQTKATYMESVNRKAVLDKQLAGLQSRVKRLSEVQAILKNLQNEYPLKGAMDSALQQNRGGIETIFSSIHSPAEFRGLGSSWTTLVREVDGSEATLSEISSGQRAAFALSIFLAQNAQLMSAPPVVLIDDPIAHVDDLNSLSFLDYLREVALKGRRQIFFTTANEKLSSLFERKFDFLGSEEFRRFNLRREGHFAISES
jgi:ABC-type lipoprotein export system ATPase subunit